MKRILLAFGALLVLIIGINFVGVMQNTLDAEAQPRTGFCVPFVIPHTCTATSAAITSQAATSFCIKNDSGSTVHFEANGGTATTSTFNLDDTQSFCEEGVANLDLYTCLRSAGSDQRIDIIGKVCQ